MTAAVHIGAFAAPARVLICRACCCGTERKHPGFDHDGQIAAISAVARTRVVDCVDECARSNVVVVRPGDGSSVWLGGINSNSLNAALCEWLADGAPQPPPAAPEAQVFIPRSGAVRARAEDVEPVGAGLEPAGAQRLAE